MTSPGRSVASARAVCGHCPACENTGDRSTAPGRCGGDPQRCAATVSGDLPAASTVAVVLIVYPAILQPVVVADAAIGPTRRCDDLHRAHLPAPPTLLSLSCALNA